MLTTQQVDSDGHNETYAKSVMDFNALVIISRHYYNELGVTL